MRQISIDDMFCEQKELLTAKEKEWLKWIAYPRPLSEAKWIYKYVIITSYPHESMAYITIDFVGDDELSSRCQSNDFDADRYFLGLVNEHKYTPRELGL